jgi:acetyl esterase
MPLNSEARFIIELMEKALPQGLHGVPIEKARDFVEAMARRRPAGPEVGRVEDQTIEGPRGTIRVRIYRPNNQNDQPALLWFHGGAFAVGSIETADYMCRELCAGSLAVVISVDYRLAPENRFPAGLDDCYAATEWVAANAASLGIDPGRIAVGGDSAGATLAAGVTLLARDRNGPSLVYQVLAYPTTLMRISSFEYAAAPIVPASMATHFWNQYVSSDEDMLSPYCCPLNALTLASLPSAFILVPEVDSTRADQELYAHRLAAAGVATTLKIYPETPHGFLGMTLGMQMAREAMSDTNRYLRLAFERFPA